MHLTYRELEGFLAYLHGVGADKRTALKGRIKHFQRLGWPSGINKGKGARVEYGIDQTLSLAIGFEMLQLGLTPEKVVDQLKSKGGFLAIAFSQAQRASDKKASSLYYAFAPESLSVLRDPDAPEKTALQSMIVPEKDLPKLMAHGGIMWRRFALINLSDLLREYSAFISDYGAGELTALSETIERWVRDEKAIDDAASTSFDVRCS